MTRSRDLSGQWFVQVVGLSQHLRTKGPSLFFFNLFFGLGFLRLSGDLRLRGLGLVAVAGGRQAEDSK